MTKPITAGRVLCALEDIPDGNSKGFPPIPGAFMGLFAVRRGRQVWVYVNSCPHIGVPLDPVPDRFLDAKKQNILCATHGARFRVEDGFCTSGPCYGESLEAVRAHVDEHDQVIVPEDAGL